MERLKSRVARHECEGLECHIIWRPLFRHRTGRRGSGETLPTVSVVAPEEQRGRENKNVGSILPMRQWQAIGIPKGFGTMTPIFSEDRDNIQCRCLSERWPSTFFRLCWKALAMTDQHEKGDKGDLQTRRGHSSFLLHMAAPVRREQVIHASLYAES